MKYSIELIPRSWENLKKEATEVLNNFPGITVLNVPDVLRFEIRSWEACRELKSNFHDVIPHLRAIDFDLKSEFRLKQYLRDSGIKTVLVIAGDPPQDLSKRTYLNTSCELIRVLKKELPEIRVYAGVDPYRSSMRKEMAYMQGKFNAGADGLFTQPFFDLKYLDVYLDLLKGMDVFWGISPVLSEKSQAYWENKNDVVFPSDFKPTKVWNIDFAKRMIDRLGKENGNIYFMPIRANISEYLGSIFG